MQQHKAYQRFQIFAGILALAVLSCSGLSDVSNLLATETPTPTSTFTPSPTLTPSPTSTPTLTPSPSPTPMPAGIQAEEQADGTTLITDYDNHYQYILPENWKVAFTSQKDLKDAVQAQADTNSDFAGMEEQFKELDPDIFRLAALNVDRKYLKLGSPTLLTANAYEDAVASSMPMAFVTAMIEDNILKDAQSTDWEVVTNGNGVEVGIVTGKSTFSFPNGVNIKVEQIVIAFQANERLIVIEIAVPQGYGDEIRTSFNGMIDSIKVDK
jgi:hypothetical protein